MHLVDQTIINKTEYPVLHAYLEKNALLSKCLYNATLFRIRQIFTGWDKQKRTANEQEVFNEVSLLENKDHSVKVKHVISYWHLDKLMKVTKNPDYYSGLPIQTAQWVLKQAVQDFKNWLDSLHEYKKHPEKYLGKPKMPKYKKNPLCTFTVTNQDAVLYPLEKGMELKLPLLKGYRFPMRHLDKDACLKEVKVIPYYGRYILSLTLETQDTPVRAGLPETAAIDFGTDNIAAIVCTDGTSRLYKGGAVLANNQWFAKKRAQAVGILTKGHEHMHADSAYLRDLSYHHANFNRDQMHKISRDIVSWCLLHKAGRLVLGINKNWKQNSSIGSANNQKFVGAPITMLRNMITYKAQMAGITVIEQEESYTSKADITAMDPIPVYGVDDKDVHFSGKRIKRGLYRCKNGLVINADCNGAANIMRKALPDIWKGRSDFLFLSTPEVLGFHELNPQSIPVKRIAV